MYFIVERIKRILTELKEDTYIDKTPIKNYKVKKVDYNEKQEVNTDTSSWDTFKEDERWGGKDSHCWFRTLIEIPKAFQGKTIVYTLETGREGQWDAINPQFLVYVNGTVVQGLDVNHREILLCEQAVVGENFDIALYAYAGMYDELIELKSNISILNRAVEQLYYNIKVPLEVAELLSKEEKNSIDILKYLTNAVNMLDLRKTFSESYCESIAAANRYLEEEFYGKYCGNNDVTAICVGHTHIDVAWLWTLAQTQEKAARSFSTVLSLMKEYPEYVFMSSQPQLYKFVKENHPDIYEGIKEMVKAGRWEPEGAMWLEADCNLSSGESLVRQILFGKRFFKEEFNIDNKILWLPDVFGYSAALPQILKKSGVDYFMTTKISWNEYNKMPYDSFNWKGIDGTEILTHFITTKDYEQNTKVTNFTTYNGIINSSQVMGAWQRYQQKDINDEVLICYGYGDGGGGPTKEMLENARRLEKGIPGAPKVKMGKAIEFFENLEKKTSTNKKFPKWVGELYLEYHRGTYTSMARNKKYNRKSEFLYEDVELLSSMNNVLLDKAYPQEEINNAWEKILLNQFHDIIPGSSIKEVYEDSQKQYEEIILLGKNLAQDTIKSLTSKINLEDLSLVVFNSLTFVRSDIVEFSFPKEWKGVRVCLEGESLSCQIISENKAVVFVENIPPKGYKTFSIEEINKENKIEVMNISKNNIENPFYNIKMDKNMNIISIFDKINEREVLKENQIANVLQAFEDKPHNFDAWDINIYYQEKMWTIDDVQKVEIIENGPVRAALRITRSFLDSTIEQTIYVYNDIRRIDFKNKIDWKEKQILLKAAFPVDIHADKATYEIQFGNVERPTHWNTSWDYARFEVCAHKWADISEGDYGVSLLNDCKYGYDIKGDVMRLTLLKSAISPNPEADKEVHEFTYSLYPHKGDWKQGKTVAMAQYLNCPMYAVVEEPHQGILRKEMSLIKINKDNVIIEVVKKAEDNEDIIVRMYECENKRSKVEAEFYGHLEGVFNCDLMENTLEAVDHNENKFTFSIKPYEIKTFRIRLFKTQGKKLI